MRQRWQLERGKWLRTNDFAWTLSDQRQANKLLRRAAALERKESGSAESSFQKAEIQWFPVRFVAHGDDAKEKLARIATLVLLVAPAMVLLAGPAILLSKLIYAVLWLGAPKIGPWALWSWKQVAWQWLGAAAVVGVGGYLLMGLFGLRQQWLYLEPRFPLVFIDYWALAPQYIWLQLTLALALMAWVIRCTGWPGVKWPNRGGKKPGMPEAPTTAKFEIPQAPKPVARVEDPDDEDYDELVTDDDTDPEPVNSAHEASDGTPKLVVPQASEDWKKEASDG